jgi:ribosome-associated protein
MTMDTTADVPIPEGELIFKTSRSSGPGGQNVNKLNTRVTVFFHLAGSPSLSDRQKQQVRSRLARRIDSRGFLHVTAQTHRSQEANRRAAVERLQQLVREALAPAPVRKKTNVPAAARERRLREKKQRSDRKQQRRGGNWGED